LQLAATVPYELVLLDWNLAGPDGTSREGKGIVEALRRAGSTAPIIIVSGEERCDWPRLVLELGLSGFVAKTDRGSVLIDAIDVARRGGILPPASDPASTHRRTLPSHGAAAGRS
jgi:DNA-binding NarL/FixJ family response regulator